jgi:hypothetical protein
MNKQAAGRLIACAGIHMNSECARVMAESGDEYRFVMREWLSEDQLRLAALLWIVDDSAPWSDVRFALTHRIPLLVPENNAPMKQICMNANCGIWYRDEAGARLCLESLLADDALRKRMGANGQAYAASSKVCAQSQRSLAAHTSNH